MNNMVDVSCITTVLTLRTIDLIVKLGEYSWSNIATWWLVEYMAHKAFLSHRYSFLVVYYAFT